jgi:eukaryotic-like serine/threonine-protein kinase
VYHAVDMNLSRPVALKILSQQFMRSEEAVQRFVQEARAASALNHPNIVTLYDIGKADVAVLEASGDSSHRQIHYIAMELIDGETLRAITARETLSLRQRVDILSQVAAGLAKAHGAGIVHRDLKPDNVMVTTDGYAKVVDFGLAKLTEKERNPDHSTSRQLTQAGTVMGTIGYMSPEQVEHRPVDYRSDIFSFGCIAYQALTARGPFERGSLIDTLHAIVHAQPEPLADIVPDAPAPLVEIVEQCLRKDPAQRPQSMREVATQLQDIARATDPSSKIVLPRARRRNVMPVALLIAAIVLVTAAVLIGVTLKRQNEQAPFDAMKITRVASSGRSTVAAISPDAKYLVYSLDEDGKQSLHIRQLASGSDIEVVPLADVHFVGAAFSPDSNFLYYVSAENKTDHAVIHQVPVIGGTSKQVVDDLHARIAMSPDGQRFAYAKTDRAGGRSIIGTRRIDGTDEKIVAERKLPDTFTAVTWSPDGTSLGFAYVTYGGGYHAVVGHVSADGGEQNIVTSPQWRIIDSLLWLPDGDEFVVNAKDSTDTRNQIWLLRRDGRARRITNDLSDYEGASLTSEGTRLVTLQKNQTSNLWIASGGSAAQARSLVRASEDLDGMYGLTALPDGRIVYSSSSNDARNLWIVNRDGTNARQLTDGNSDILPSAASDGKSVVFMSMRSGRSNIWRADLATAATAPITTGDFESSPSLAPDGTWLAYHTNRSGVRTIWRAAIDGSRARQVTTTASSWPSISPDGKLIACSWFDPTNGRIGIAVVPSEGGPPAKIFDIPVNAWMGGNNHHVRWRRDGLTYVQNSAGVSNIWLQPLDGGQARPLTRFDDGQIFYFDWSADGRDLIVSRGSVTSNVVLISGFR